MYRRTKRSTLSNSGDQHGLGGERGLLPFSPFTPDETGNTP